MLPHHASMLTIAGLFSCCATFLWSTSHQQSHQYLAAPTRAVRLTRTAATIANDGLLGHSDPILYNYPTARSSNILRSDPSQPAEVPLSMSHSPGNLYSVGALIFAGASMLYLLFAKQNRSALSWSLLSTSVLKNVNEPESSSADKMVDEVSLCCPTCLTPLQNAVCPRCRLQYNREDKFINLTPASGQPLVRSADPVAPKNPLLDIPFVQQNLPLLEQFEKALPPIGGLPMLSNVIKGGYLGERRTYGKNLFESPVMAAFYDRGWRQAFAGSGFPGADAEFDSAMGWLKPVAGGAVLDLSCGPGIFTTRLIASGQFTKVIALDFSENMLDQVAQSVDADSQLKRKAQEVSLELVRGDALRLPFSNGSLAAVHAGAAIHCWPSPSLGMTEVARVLKPGGRAVLSTFLLPGQDNPLLNEELRQVLFSSQLPSGIKYFEVSELRDLSARVGLVNFEFERRRGYVMFKVEKPQL